MLTPGGGPRRASTRGLTYRRQVLTAATLTGRIHFRRDLARTLADPERLTGLRHDRLAPLEDAIGELSGWYAFSDAFKRDQERRAGRLGLVPSAAPQPLINPFKNVGRNDPCPCGSGKKFKKCCLH